MHSARMVPMCAWADGSDPHCCETVGTLPRMVGPSHQKGMQRVKAVAAFVAPRAELLQDLFPFRRA
jgi:hypothetical protein